MNPETTRHLDWVKVEPSDGAIRGGDRYRVERSGGAAYEFDAPHDWEQKDFDPSNAYFIWPRPTPKPWEGIPEGDQNAAVMAVSVDGYEPVVGTYFRVADGVFAVDPDSSEFYVGPSTRVTSVVPATVVPSEALEALRGAFARWEDGDVGMDTIEWGKVASSFLAAIDGADQA